MSNLWFFRLKRAEQQRRRSSGEQSVGSASVQSAAGVSASSLPAGGGGAQQSAVGSPRGSQVSATLLRADFDHNDDDDYNDDYHRDYDHYDRYEHDLHNDHQHHFQERPTEAQWAPSQQEARRVASGESTAFTTSSGQQQGPQTRCNSDLKSQETTSGASRTSSKLRATSWRQQHRELRSNNNNNNRRESQEMGPINNTNSATIAANRRAPTQVPQVTIIRSDSTSSYIPMGSCGPEISILGPPDAEGAPNERHSSSRKQFVAVSELNESSGLVESNLARSGSRSGSGSGSRSSSSSLPPSQAVNKTIGSQRQQQFADQLKSDSKTGNMSHHLHDQLNSGKVPPIHERLLNPNGGPQGLSLADSMDNLASLIPRVRVEFYNSENTLKEQLQLYLIKDHQVSFIVRSAKLILEVLACYLYVCRVIFDRGPAYATCYGCQPNNSTSMRLANSSTMQLDNSVTGGGGGGSQPATSTASHQPVSKFDSHPYDGPINFEALFWVDRGPGIWALQTTIAVICFIEAILMQYLTYKKDIFSIIFSFHFTLELITTVPFIMSIFCKELRTLFVPGFLNCWLAKQCLEVMLNDLSVVKQWTVFGTRLTVLLATIFCLIFTSACGFQHTQRAGGRNYVTIFESIYFVVVTFSTVGYGDFKPETWPSQLFIMVMICVALIVLPTQFEQLAYFWIERKKLGASYAHHSTRHEKHVVVCSTTLRADTIMDFLNEFYAHPLLQTFSVVLLSPCELDTTMKLVLQTPTWNNRVVYIQGSALKATDLIRARMQSAEACFILAARNYNDRSAADEHTILRSWAIRDFSPYVPQYVQIFRTENKIHVAFAEHVVCDDEFKYALLANNCLIPGTSTLVTLLLHTSQQHQHQHRRRRARHRNTTSSLLGRFLGRQGGGGGGGSLSRRARGRRKDQSGSTGGNNSHRNHDQDDDDQDLDQDDDDEQDGPEWKRLYGKCSANEIYHIRLSDSRFFGEYQGKSFTYASFHSHRKFGVALIGVQTDMRGTWPIMLNPGPSYVLKSGDILFYINITKEENSALMPMMHHQQHQQQQQQQSSSSFAAQKRASGGLLVEPAGSGANDALLDGDPNGPAGGGGTYIRIEASSPTAANVGVGVAGGADETSGVTPLCPPLVDTIQPPAYLDSGQHQRQLVKKHSVADGASRVARSMCSIAGIPGALMDLPRAPSRDSDEDNQQGPQGPTTGRGHELQHLTTMLLAKRVSSASTSAATAAASAAATGAVSTGLGSRNASTLELAAIATGLRKGSNMSITSTRSRDASPTRLKQVVSGLAVKMKRVKLGKSLTHLTIPRMDLGGGSSASSTESFVNARGRRPSIAPVPAMMGESEDHDSDHEREQESYFAMSWHSSSESSPIVKKFVFCTTYVGVSPTLCYLLQRKKPPCCLQLVQACEHCPFKNARQYNWPNRCIILASDFASNGIYNFLVPLRAHFHNPNELRPIVLLLERKPSPQFIDAISWFPMVYWMPGSIDNLDDLIKAGINLAHSVVVTNKESTNSAEEDYLADCNTIVAVQTMFKMFPSVGIITELSQSSNMRFMQFRAHDLLFGGLTMASLYQQQQFQQQQQQLQLAANRLAAAAAAAATAAGSSTGLVESTGADGGQTSQQSDSAAAMSNLVKDRIQLRKLHSQYYSEKMSKEANSHAYKYRLPFAAGNVFSASMLDTLLYQAFVKDYMITMVRLLLGIDQAPGSGFLSSMKITKEELWIRTYGRLYQRLCSTTCEIPLGIYRTEPLETTKKHDSFSFGAFTSQQASYEQATEELERIEISNMVKNRLQDLGMLVSDYDDSTINRNNTFSYVIINPNCDIKLREGDIIYLIRPSPIHSRKLFMHRANSVRHTDQQQQQQQQQAQSGFTQGNLQSAAPNLGSKSQPTKLDPYNTTANNKQHEQSRQSDLARHPQAPIASGQHQAAPKSTDTTANSTNNQGGLKSYFSDGDFSEVLIKVSSDHDDDHDHDHDDQHQDQDREGRQQSTPSKSNTGETMVNLGAHNSDNFVGPSEGSPGSGQSRRRSSCSDAELDSKRSSLS